MARGQGRGSLRVYAVREGLAAKGLEQQPEKSEEVRSGKSSLETGNSKHKGPRWKQDEAAVLEDQQADQSVCGGVIRGSERRSGGPDQACEPPQQLGLHLWKDRQSAL